MKQQNVIICSGCEAECQVYIIYNEGKIISVEGNNCPTGEIFARSIVRRQYEENIHHHKE